MLSYRKLAIELVNDLFIMILENWAPDANKVVTTDLEWLDQRNWYHISALDRSEFFFFFEILLVSVSSLLNPKCVNNIECNPGERASHEDTTGRSDNLGLMPVAVYEILGS